MSRTPFYILIGLIFFALSSIARGGAVQFQLGEQDFADGKTPIYSYEIRDAGAGEAFPFDGTVFGHDVKSTGLGAFDYTHAFDLGGHQPLSAKLVVGLIDIDSPPDQPFETIGMTLNGVEQSTAKLAGISASDSASSVEVVELPVSIDLLAGGKLDVGFYARRPGYGNLGNAIEADFSRLVVEVAPNIVPGPIVDPEPNIDPPPPIIEPGPRPIPLPPAVFSAGILLLSLAARSARRRAR
jgi:hypothetical protein